MQPEDAERIGEFINSFGIYSNYWSFSNDSTVPLHVYDNTFEDITRALGYAIMNKHRFGGNERKIHTKTVPEIKDLTYRVSKRRVVKTGTRTTEYEYDDNGGGGSWSYLSNEKTHVIYTVKPVFYYLPNSWSTDGDKHDINSDFEIEKCNIEKVTDPTLILFRGLSGIVTQ
jgi:hypothetical protein